MSEQFSIVEIFEMAEQIERNGANFYRKAADITSNKTIRSLLKTLADTEDEHEKLFLKMRDRYARQNEPHVFDPDNETAAYLKGIASSSGWEGKVAPAIELRGNETVGRILTAAIQAEKDSISFYLGIKNAISSEQDRQIIDKIIKEEMGHVSILQKQMAQWS